MKKIYKFESLNNNLAISLDEFQADPEQVLLRIHQNDQILLLPFSKDEFYDLCGMRYRLDFAELAVQSPVFALVAA